MVSRSGIRPGDSRRDQQERVQHVVTPATGRGAQETRDGLAGDAPTGEFAGKTVGSSGGLGTLQATGPLQS